MNSKIRKQKNSPRETIQSILGSYRGIEGSFWKRAWKQCNSMDYQIFAVLFSPLQFFVERKL